MKTPADVRAHFKAIGMPVAEWARQHGYSPVEAYRVLDGVTKGLKGRSREIAIKLGLKAA